MGPGTLKKLIEESDWYPDDMVVMQYTGLKDKNGVEIYEGDVVEFGPYPDQLKRLRGLVAFKEGCFGIDVPDEGFYSFPGWKLFEVIGTIWENPELLHQEAHENQETKV